MPSPWLLVLVALYLYFFWNTQRWTNFAPDYAAHYTTPAEPVATGDRPAGGIVTTTEEAGAQAQTCRRSLIVDATADLVDFNVNQNAWISSMILGKLGLFGIPWERTPFFDNKAAFQRGINQAVRRTAIETPRRFLQLDPFTLLAALEADDREAAADVVRLRSVGLMLSRSVPALTLGAAIALVEIFTGRIALFAALTGLVLALVLCVSLVRSPPAIAH